ncbi:MAG: LysM peptidoglycan-binding domain-containing protein [Anaerolineae bacterium]
MSGQDQAQRVQNLAGQKSRGVAVIISLGIALLVVGCARFTYDEMPMPSSVPYVAPPPASTLATSTAVAASDTPTPMPTLAGPTMLRIEPSVVDLAVGETRLVQVWLDNVERLYSIELHVGFEPGYVHIEDADPDAEGIQIGKGVIPMPAQVTQNEADNDAGLIVYHVAQAPGTPVNGSGMVASFTIRAVAEGGSPLRFNIVKLLDPEEQALPEPEQADGLVIISAGDATPEPTAEATLTGTPLAATSSATTPVTTAPIPTLVPTSPSTTSGIYYTVQPGENLFRISRRYGTTEDAIVAANNLPDRSSVQAGQLLLIPVSPPNGTLAYVVQPGDWLWSIARRFNTTPEALAALNGIASPYTIQPGQMLVIVP